MRVGTLVFSEGEETEEQRSKASQIELPHPRSNCPALSRPLGTGSRGGPATAAAHRACLIGVAASRS